MGPRRETSEAPRGRGVASSKGVSDLEEKAQEEQEDLIRALVSTVHHFFGGFSPSVCPRHGPPRSPQDYLSSFQSGLRRDDDVSISTQGETADWILTPQRSLNPQIPGPLWCRKLSSRRYLGCNLFESGG